MMNLLDEVVLYAEKNSDDPRLQVGAGIVDVLGNVVFGTNRFRSIPEGFTKEQLVADRDLKLKHITHAEEDAILSGGDLRGATLFVNYTPCLECGQKIVAAGINTVVVKRCENEAVAARWKESWDKSIELLRVNGIQYEER